MKVLMNKMAAQAASKAIQATTAIKLVAVVFLSFTSINVAAQATVRDSAPISAPAVAPSSDPSQQSADYNLIFQLQQLQQEVLELRGLAEEQAFEIKRLKQQRLDDYLDLDKRISELSQQRSSTNTTSKTPDTTTGALSTLSNNSTTAIPASVTSESEKQLYRQAIDQLLNKQDYAGAQTSFDQYLSDYPAGTYVPNVHYWQGQIYLSDSKKDAAIKSFSALLKDYPSHQKAPDAKYKLATIYFDQGKKAEAKKMLDEVVASNSDASRLAKAFLANQYQ